MMPSPPSLFLRAACAGALLLAALAPAQAQYSWLDAKGTRVFSDRPPPPGTPTARILKAPRAVAAPPYGAVEATPAPPSAPAPAQAARPSVAQQEAEFRKRSAARQQAEQKAGQEQGRQAAVEARCNSLKREAATMAAGTRLSEFDEKGARRYIDDAERAARLAQARAAQAAECR